MFRQNIESVTDLNNLSKKNDGPSISDHRPDFSDNSEKSLIARLQAELEKQRLEHGVALQTVRRESSDEIEQLKHTIALIRDELENHSQHQGGSSELCRINDRGNQEPKRNYYQPTRCSRRKRP